MENFEFNLQQFLEGMRHEQREGHYELAEKIDQVASKVGAHETRLVMLEETRKNLRWVVATVVGAALTVAGPPAYDFLKKLSESRPSVERVRQEP